MKNKQINFVNLTPHAINIYDNNGQNIIATFPATGTVARVATHTKDAGEIGRIPVVSNTFGDVEGLPEPQAETVYLVSIVVASALNGTRPDVLVPDTSPAGVVRNESGQILGVKRLAQS